MKENKGYSGQTAFAASEYTKERDYWLNQLTGEWVKAHFPYDHIPTQGNERELQTVSFTFTGELFSQLVILSSGSDAKLHMILVAGLLVLLYKYTYHGNLDITLGTPIYRQDFEAEFINTILVLRNQLTPGMTFKELLIQVRETIIEADENLNYPLERIAEKLNRDPGTDEDDCPLFDIMVLLENIHDKKYIRHVHPVMTFSFLRSSESLQGNVEYNGRLYRKTSIERLTLHLAQVLQKVLPRIDLTLDRIDILLEEEKKQLLDGFNDTGTEYPGNKTLHQWIEEQSAKTPDHIALMGPGSWTGYPLPTDPSREMDMLFMSYRELNQKSNQLARVLRKKGITPDTIVGIMVDRAVEMVVGMLAVLKAGGAFLPISSMNPTARKRFMLQDSGTPLVLTQKNRKQPDKDAVQAFSDENILFLDDETIYNGGKTNLEIVHQSNSLAYVIYISGSLGRPCGVTLEHSALIHFVYSMYANYNRDFGPQDKALCWADISLDVSLGELFLSLFFGAAAVLLPDEGISDPKELARIIIEKTITFAYIPPVLLKEVGSHLRDHGPGVILNKLLVGGEPLEDNLLHDYRPLNDGMQIIYGYGLTETTICAATYQYDWHSSRKSNDTVPIGKPLNHTKIVLLDQQQNLNPPGVPGEIGIAGPCLARGYLNQPQLTAEKFVENPFFPGLPMYKSGDLGRWGEDSNIQFLDTSDHQVIIRGYRIQLEEIRGQLLNHPAIKEAVVIDRGSHSMDKYLCAYIVSHSAKVGPGNVSASAPDTAELIDFLAKQLPPYMIPLYFVPVEKIPVTPTNEVDRNLLPDPKVSSETEYIAPRNEVEEVITNIWKEILKRDRISINDNFFELGGNSLGIIQVNKRLKEVLGIEVMDIKLLEFPTISSFYNYLSQEMLVETQAQQNVDDLEIEMNPTPSKLRDRKRIMTE
ncbi:MAG: amino acid adenylation domain-containing protein [Candidatus Aminicenantes bacterium]|nr:MAG: amino acid adenylation domain-containing protein [Candidatus Aminicenantes bacterium]